MREKSGSGMNIPDNFSESLETVLGLKILKFFYADRGFRIFLALDLGSGWKNSDAGLPLTLITV
jgi:hypothetical protein